MSSLQKDMFKKGRLPSLESVTEDEQGSSETLLPMLPKNSLNDRLKAKYAPVSWDAYFDKKTSINIPNTQNHFCIYHTTIPPSESPCPIFIMHHGAGQSALTFGPVAKLIKEQTQGQCAVMALDCRGHGDTTTEDDGNLSLSCLTEDLIGVVRQFLDRNHELVLVGHSMGGSVVVDVAYHQRLENIVGIVVLDVVEGSALASLQSMPRLLSTRPTQFESIEQAIHWTVKSKMVRNVESARVSVPPLIVKTTSNTYVWRANLESTGAYWEEWFKGLSDKFLGCKGAKMLMLAGTDRLDTPLMIGQMQGKFQVHIFPESGHFLHEDEPGKTTLCLVEFWKRNQRLVLPAKTA